MCHRREVPSLAVLALVLAACGSEVARTTIPTTVASTTTSTTSTPVQVAAVDYYRFGDHGLYRVVRGVETLLVDEPVDRAWDDDMGGVIYTSDLPSAYWIPSTDGLTEIVIRRPRFVALVGGRATAVAFEHEPEAEGGGDLVLTDLQTGNDRRIVGIFYEGDGWSVPTSYGGGLFVGVEGAAFGCGYSDHGLAFWDDSGDRIDHPHNPVTDCGPCELSAIISPDGRFLAYSHRADSPSEYHGRLECGQSGLWDDWWASTQDISGQVVVIELETGTEMFRTTSPAQTRVADFDGRYLVVEENLGLYDKPAATIYDTWGEQSSVRVPGGVALIRRGANTD